MLGDLYIGCFLLDCMYKWVTSDESQFNSSSLEFGGYRIPYGLYRGKRCVLRSREYSKVHLDSLGRFEAGAFVAIRS